MGTHTQKKLIAVDGMSPNPMTSSPDTVFFEDGQFVIDTGRGLDVRGPLSIRGQAIIAGGGYIPVTSYGFTTNGLGAAAAINSAAINAAYSAAVAASGGIILYPGGVHQHLGNIPVSPGITHRGVPNSTVLLTASGAPSGNDAFRSSTFQANSGAVHNDGDHNCGLEDLTIDGNADNNAFTRHGLAIYGAGYFLNRVRFRNHRGSGLWSEWNPTSTSSLDAGGLGVGIGDMSMKWDDLEVYNNYSAVPAPSASNYSGLSGSVSAQIALFGPHDGSCRDITVYQTLGIIPGQRGLLAGMTSYSGGQANSSTGLKWVNSNIYQNHDVGLDIATGYCHYANMHVEGANVNILMRAGPTHLEGNSHNSQAGGEGIRIHGGNMNHIKLGIFDIGLAGYGVCFRGGFPVNSFLDIACFNNSASAFLYTGNIPGTSRVFILNANGSLQPFQGIAVRQTGTG